MERSPFLTLALVPQQHTLVTLATSCVACIHVSVKPTDSGQELTQRAKVCFKFLLIFELTTNFCNIALQCPDLQAPSNGDVFVTGFIYTSTATYSCDNAYILVGESVRTCQADGSWSGIPPYCQGTCHHIQLHTNLQ